MGNMCNICSCIYERKGVGYTCIAVLFLLGLGCILQLFFVGQAVDNAFNEAIDDQIIMTQAQKDANTEEYQAWQSNRNEDDPLQLFEYWIYNITNPYDVPNGADPIFDLIGPFVFRRLEDRENVIFYEDPEEYEEFGSPFVEYTYVYEFVYLEEESSDIPLEAQVFTMSGAMQGLFGNINGPNGGLIPQCVFDEMSTWPGDAIFYNGPISGLVYGFRDPYVEDRLNEACTGNPIWPLIAPNTFFSLLPEGDNEVYQYTGKNDRSRVAELIQYRNWTEPEVNSWKLGGGLLWCIDRNEELGPCHRENVTGSRETRQFAPRDEIDENSELIVWSIEKFRQTAYTFQKKVTFKGVELMRFVLDDKELKGCQYTYDNACSEDPTPSPSNAPTISTQSPTLPTTNPTTEPTVTRSPTSDPTIEPTKSPTGNPTTPTTSPSMEPTLEPTTMLPTTSSDAPSLSPTAVTTDPTNAPSMEPTIDTIEPTSVPSQAPTCQYQFESHTCKYFQFWLDEQDNVVDGVANLTNLRGSPSFMSKGRFLDAPYFIETVTNRFEGLEEPEEERDDQYFDIDPKTGIVFRNYHNYQMNFEFYPINRDSEGWDTNFTNLTHVIGVLIPFVYVRVEAIATDDQMEFYADTLNQIDVIKGFSLYGGPALAVVFFGLMFFILCKMKRSAGRADLEYGRLVENNDNNNNNNDRGAISMQKSELNGNTDGNGYGTIK